MGAAVYDHNNASQWLVIVVDVQQHHQHNINGHLSVMCKTILPLWMEYLICCVLVVLREGKKR